MKNYRTISGHPYMSKLSEELVVQCILEHIQNNELPPLKVHSDIAETVDKVAKAARLDVYLNR